MDMEDACQFLRNLELRQRVVLYNGADGTRVSATRTDRKCPHDFAVRLHRPRERAFLVTHVRLLIDLHLKFLSNQEDARQLLIALERVYDGDDPVELARGVANLNFPFRLDAPDVNLLYTQLLMIEQEFNYGPNGGRPTRYNPPRNLLMSFIRWVASREGRIDAIITAALRRRLPPVRFERRIAQLTTQPLERG